jgi:hypothetical protein
MHRIVKKRIEELSRAGDHGGVEAWSQVADQLMKLRTNRKVVSVETAMGWPMRAQQESDRRRGTEKLPA